MQAIQSQSSHASKLRPVVRVALGNVLEMYDFQIFGYYAFAIGRTFFPSSSEFGSLMLSMATFGAGFLMRPIGAVVLGAYIDHRGRRAGLLLTLALMAFGTLTIACLPGYELLGVAAPLLVLFGRLAQGFSAGAELGGVSVYLSEISMPGRRGLFVSLQSASQQLAVMFTSLLGIVLASLLTRDQMVRWGWRVPLLAGCLLVPFLFLLRRSLEETGEFLVRRQPSVSKILRSLWASWRLVLLGMSMSIMTTVCFYLATVYTPTFGSTVLRLTEKDVLIVVLCVGALNIVVLPLSGALSDRIGRRPILFICTALALATAYPALTWLVHAPSFFRLLTVDLWIAILYATYNGAMAVFLVEILPVEVRVSGFSLAYSLATAVFGGFTPAICTYLIHVTGNPAMPGVWLSFAAVCALSAVIALSTGPAARRE